MKTDLFDFQLPPHLIAQHPAEKRDHARMMVLHRATKTIEHRGIADIAEYMRPNDALVLNNTKVIPARVFGHKTTSGGKVELLLLHEQQPGLWKVLMKTSRRPKPGEKMALCSNKAIATMLEEGEQGEALLKIETQRPFMEILDEEGLPPLPPYIDRKTQTREQIEIDKQRYQTVYASQPGSAAAPTAGLHFTRELLEQLTQNGITKAELTLHVGLGTFRPVSVDNILDHEMHAEHYTISAKAAEIINASKAAGARTVAVGSTSVRTLETVGSPIKAAEGATSIFIYPGYTYQVVDAILTNFHLPKSTLLMMMSAFAGRDLMLEAYRIAVAEKYRFFSYGDCMLIL
jgi:S-adenosylmethionine:tRNA ribosyltransferase-isomerase